MTNLHFFSLALSFAAQGPIKWCIISDAELLKCNKLKKAMETESFSFECVMKKHVKECMTAIKVGTFFHSVLIQLFHD